MLTATLNRTIIDPHSQKTSVGITTPGTTGQKAASVYYDNAVFLCPLKIISTALVRLKSVMVGCIGQLSSWPVPVAGCGNPVQPASNYLPLVRDGYIPITGETAMRNHAQKPTNSVSVNQPKINYTQHGNTSRMSATGLTIEQALKLWNTYKVSGGAA